MLHSPGGLKEIADRVKFDLVSAGFTPLPDDCDGPEGGVAVWVEKGQVMVIWHTHDRLGEAEQTEQNMREAGLDLGPVVQREQAARSTMCMALVTLLTAFGYPVRTIATASHIAIDL
ncbi:hypothetical protein AB0942_32230 [Streptomyces nodosus]|uniref:hypothetical protein n=1 Tax=Streptomyces nodosus TaxID=40318 RepID=UPI003452D010